DLDVLEKAIIKATNRFPDIRIYNLSIASRKPLDEKHPSELTELLDKIARERDILFVCAAGNNTLFEHTEYPDIFNRDFHWVKVASPSDALNVLTVGAVCKVADQDSAAPAAGFPSPFTRGGLVRGVVKKPDLIAYGGNY